MEVAYLWWELLRNIKAPRGFIAIVHCENEELVQAMAIDLEQDAWLSRIISLREEEPVDNVRRNEWHACAKLLTNQVTN